VIPRRLVDGARMQPAGCRLFAANGTVINVMGEITLDVCLGDLTLLTKFVASDNVTEPMLGSNWLRQYQMIWDFRKDLLLVHGRVFRLIPEEENRARERAKIMLDRVRAAALEDKRIRRYAGEDDEAQRGFKRARQEKSKPICVTSYEESKPIRVTSYVESKPIFVTSYVEFKLIRVTSYKKSKPIRIMNRIIATPLFSDDHSGRTADIINAEETE